MSTWCKVSIWGLVAVTIVLVIIKLIGFGPSSQEKLWMGLHWVRGWDGWESSEGTGDMREVSDHEFILSSLSVSSQGLPPSSAPELLIYLAPHV